MGSLALLASFDAGSPYASALLRRSWRPPGLASAAVLVETRRAGRVRLSALRLPSVVAVA